MKKIALIIGNSKYQNTSQLKNPINDANDIAECITKLDFDVTKATDVCLSDFYGIINDFLKEIVNYDVALFYYAGHGMQIDGNNYLVPIDCIVSTKEATVLSCYNMDNIFRGLNLYNNKTNIVILDACRDNPFSRSISSQIGFAAVPNPPKGTIISFATSPGAIASDGENTNGLYTEVLKRFIDLPNVKIEDMFKKVRTEVVNISDDNQISWEHSSLIGDFYFNEDLNVQPLVSGIIASETYKNKVDNTIFVEEWIHYNKHPERSIVLDELGGFFNRGLRWKDYIEEFHIYKRPYLKALRMDIITRDKKITGREHQKLSDGVPKFNNNTVGIFSMRAWGDLMAAIWSDVEDYDYSYLDFYM